MHVLRVRNVNQALPAGISELYARGIPTPSRYGDVRVLPEPVTTVYSNPTERVLFGALRDANPFFHLMESLWLLRGRNDVAFVARFADRMRSFSDDGKTLAGAYGYRLRHHFSPDGAGGDQIELLVELLKRSPRSRRAVLTMWDPFEDLCPDEADRKDVPCNTQIYVWNLAGRLQMTVTCRSNDIVWGAYGSNAVMFSMLQEYLAARLGWEVGTLYQISNNYHGYLNTLEPLHELAEAAPQPWRSPAAPLCLYGVGHVAPYPLVANPDIWDRDLALFFEDPAAYGFDNPFFSQVAKPMYWAHAAWRVKDDSERFQKAFDILQHCTATDWRRAATDWILRRQAAAMRKAGAPNA